MKDFRRRAAGGPKQLKMSGGELSIPLRSTTANPSSPTQSRLEPNALKTKHYSPQDADSTPLVISIQSDILGNRTYALTLRDCFARVDDLRFRPFWYKEDRSLATKVLHRIACYSLPGIGGNHKNLDFSRLRKELSYGRTSRILLQRLLAKEHPDVVHFHTQIQAFGAVPIMRRAPSVVSIDMTIAQASREKGVPYPGTYRFSIARERRVFEAAAHIVTWSEWARRSVIEDHGIPASKVSVISPGANLRTFQAPDFTQKSLPLLLFVGGDFRRKGGWDLLKVFEQQLSGKAELHVVTQTPIPVLPKGVIQHNGIAPYSPEWHSLFRGADIFVLPSHAEALGLVFQEAGGYGLALVGGNVGGIPELIRDGENGFLVTPGDLQELGGRLLELLQDSRLLATMRARSHQIALESFDADRNTRKLANIFLQIASRNPEKAKS